MVMFAWTLDKTTTKRHNCLLISLLLWEISTCCSKVLVTCIVKVCEWSVFINAVPKMNLAGGNIIYISEELIATS